MNNVDDLIAENTVSSNPSQSKGVNAGKASSKGIEISMEHYPVEFFQWFANFTYTSTEVKNSLDPDQDGADISFVPDTIANLGFTARLPFNITITPSLNRVGRYYDSTSRDGRQEFGPYETINVHVVRKVVTKTTDYTLNAGLDLNNLANRKYTMPWQFQDPGFNLLASLEVTF